MPASCSLVTCVQMSVSKAASKSGSSARSSRNPETSSSTIAAPELTAITVTMRGTRTPARSASRPM